MASRGNIRTALKDGIIVPNLHPALVGAASGEKVLTSEETTGVEVVPNGTLEVTINGHTHYLLTAATLN